MSATNSVVCEEIFDEASHPSADEIRDYATKIGIDPENEPQLLPLAAEGLMKALPPGWKPILCEKTKSYYYFNNITGKTQWEHPLDDIYRSLVKKKRTESQSVSLCEITDDATYGRDDLPSFEESFIPLKHHEIAPSFKREGRLSPIKTHPKDISPPRLIRQKSEENPVTSYINKKIGLSLSTSFDGKPDVLRESPKREFKLSGGGSMFLKGSKKADESPEKKTTNILKSGEKGDENKVDEHIVEKPRGILRERSFIENTKIQEEEDKKNVRFNIDDSEPNEIISVIEEEKNLVDINLMLKDKPKSRFSIKSPENYSQNLKLIKPNPTDYVKPKIKSIEPGNAISDSEDDSILKSIEKRNEKRFKEEEEKKEENEGDESPLSQDHKESISKKYREDNVAIIKQLKENADRELENMKKTIWEEKNDEIVKYKQKIQESQSKELERILSTEKGKYEENIKMELENLRLEMENRNLGALEQERQKLKDKLEKMKEELESVFKLEDEKLQKEFEEHKNSLRKKYEMKFEETEMELKRELEKRKDELIVSHNAILDQFKQNHQAILEELKQDYKSEEKIIRKERENQLSDLRKKINNLESESSSHAKDLNEERLYEKVRCEKRLLEDKYRCLKEKYIRLKTEVKLSIEKRNRKREQSVTTGSETDRSNSNNKDRSPHRPSLSQHITEKPPFQKSDLNSNRHKSDLKPRTVLIQELDTSTSDHSLKHDIKYDYDSPEDNVVAGRSRKKLFTRLKSSSTTRLNNNKSKKSLRSCSPVENLRRQLQKLEDLEDQFPQNAQCDTYHLRYPFSDGQKFEGSSELEFFRHRIHLERDSIKRAKESLRTQKCLFQQRQNDLKLKHGSMARHTFQQLCQEEKDLTDMEVSLHRTRSLLGEKVIRLRHLEQSLQRATAASNDQLKEETTLSDLSSHSASSGISSTEFATAHDGHKTVLRGEHLQESSEIIQSLENLNSEIREIWEVLSQQQQTGNMPSVMPLPLVYPDLGWPVLAGTATVPAPPSIPTLADRLHNYRQHVALANAQSTVVTHAANQGATTTLVERTRNLRQWLRQTGIDPGTDGTATQTTL